MAEFHGDFNSNGIAVISRFTARGKVNVLEFLLMFKFN